MKVFLLSLIIAASATSRVIFLDPSILPKRFHHIISDTIASSCPLLYEKEELVVTYEDVYSEEGQLIYEATIQGKNHQTGNEWDMILSVVNLYDLIQRQVYFHSRKFCE